MFDPVKDLPKPLACNQVWEDMLPTDGGRICRGCGKLVVDFRKFKWYEIEQAQRESIVPLCGMYSTKQMDNWGVDVSPPATGSKLVKLSAALLAVTQLTPVSLTAHTKVPQQQVAPSQQKNPQKPQQKQVGAAPLKRIISGTVVVQTTDTTRLPLSNAIVSVACNGKFIQSTTDSVGRFTLDLTGYYKKLRDTVEIEVIHPEHLRNIIEYPRRNIKPAGNNLMDIILNDVQVNASSYKRSPPYDPGFVSVSYFGVAPRNTPSNPPKIESPAKSHKIGTKIKAWWQRITKKKKDN